MPKTPGGGGEEKKQSESATFQLSNKMCRILSKFLVSPQLFQPPQKESGGGQQKSFDLFSVPEFVLSVSPHLFTNRWHDFCHHFVHHLTSIHSHQPNGQCASILCTISSNRTDFTCLANPDVKSLSANADVYFAKQCG